MSKFLLLFFGKGVNHEKLIENKDDLEFVRKSEPKPEEIRLTGILEDTYNPALNKCSHESIVVYMLFTEDIPPGTSKNIMTFVNLRRINTNK